MFAESTEKVAKDVLNQKKEKEKQIKQKVDARADVADGNPSQMLGALKDCVAAEKADADSDMDMKTDIFENRCRTLAYMFSGNGKSPEKPRGHNYEQDCQNTKFGGSSRKQSSLVALMVFIRTPSVELRGCSSCYIVVCIDRQKH